MNDKQPEHLELPNAIWLAKFLHDAYERLAPQYGYVTREDTRTFDHESPNGRLMAAVCEELRQTLSTPSWKDRAAKLETAVRMAIQCLLDIQERAPGTRDFFDYEAFIGEQLMPVLIRDDSPPD